MSVIMDHYRSKKRRACLSGMKHSPSSELSKSKIALTNEVSPCDKGIPHPKKKQRKVSPSLVGSSDESTHEIHWDNDSSTPSQAKKTKKSSRRNVKNNISTLLKHVPRKTANIVFQKSSITSSEEVQGEMLSTWMLENLASNTSNMQNVHKRITRSCSTKRNSSSKGEALHFNQEIRKFLQQVNKDPSTDSEMKDSIPYTTIASTNHIPSPNYFSSAETDSLLNFDISGDSILSDLDSISLSKTPQRDCQVVLKRPQHSTASKKHKNNMIKKTSPLATVLTVVKEDEKPTLRNNDKNAPVSALRRSKRNVNSSSVSKGIKEKTPDSTITTISSSRVTKNLAVEFENDELEKLLLTQPNILAACTNPSEVNKSKNGSHPVPDVKNDLDCKTPSTGLKMQSDIDVSVCNDDDIFDNILANVDIDFKFKSQETPCLTNDQRKLKSRCHTSPLPLNTNKNKKFQLRKPFERTPLEPQTSSSLKKSLVKPLHVKDCAVYVCTSDKSNRTIGNSDNTGNFSQRSYVSPGIATAACRKPFMPPNKNPAGKSRDHSSMKSQVSNLPIQKSMSSSMVNILPSFDVSLIKGNNAGETVDSQETISNQEYRTYSSTQKCTMSEIEQKRKHAQRRLRQRLCRKAK